MTENKPKYEQIWSIQEAINKAAAEKRVVRFLWKASNEEIRKAIVDLKGCKLLKKDKDSDDVAVMPKDMAGTFDFDAVDTSLTLSGSGLLLPGRDF